MTEVPTLGWGKGLLLATVALSETIDHYVNFGLCSCAGKYVGDMKGQNLKTFKNTNDNTLYQVIQILSDQKYWNRLFKW